MRTKNTIGCSNELANTWHRESVDRSGRLVSNSGNNISSDLWVHWRMLSPWAPVHLHWCCELRRDIFLSLGSSPSWRLVVSRSASTYRGRVNDGTLCRWWKGWMVLYCRWDFSIVSLVLADRLFSSSSTCPSVSRGTRVEVHLRCLLNIRDIELRGRVQLICWRYKWPVLHSVLQSCTQVQQASPE